MRILHRTLLPFLFLSPVHAMEDVPGWDGWNQASYDEAWNDALARRGLPPDHPRPINKAGRARGTARTECVPSDGGEPDVYDIELFPDMLKAKHGITDNADLNDPEIIDSLGRTFTHELIHQCLRDAGLPCPPDEGGEACEELAVSQGVIDTLCKEVDELCKELCKLKEEADDPPTDEQQQAMDELQEKIDALCKLIEEEKDKYRGEDEDGNEVSEGWAEQLCECLKAGWDGIENVGNCGANMPPDPGGGENCDLPDGEPVDIFRGCDNCPECKCGEDDEDGVPPEEEDDGGDGNG